MSIDIRKNQGFTLIELITVIAITVSLAALTMPVLGNLGPATALNDDTKQIEQALFISRERACAGLDASAHGIYFNDSTATEHSLILFSGDSYETRMSEKDEEIVLDPSISTENNLIGSTLVFSRGDCLPNQTGEISVISETTGYSKSLLISTLGTISEE